MMNGLHRLCCLSACAGFLVVACGCALVKPDSKDIAAQVPIEVPDSFGSLVSRDMVSVLVQVEKVAPNRTLLSTSSKTLQQGTFADALKVELQRAGYATRSVGTSPDSVPVSYSFGPAADASPQARTITVIVGDVALRRTYTFDAVGRVSPLGTMQVKGVQAENLSVDSGIFLNSTPLPASDPLPPEPKLPEPVVNELQDNELQAAGKPETLDIAALTADQESPSLFELIAPTVARAQGANTQNVRVLEQSNYESIFSDMGIVSEKILTFPNDSIRMGSGNKALLRKLLDSFDPSSDILSVVGCSLGPTQYEGGQEGLARGRANRVRDELLFAGVPKENILQEGCWAEEGYDQRMPRRGVVITLKRELG